MIKKIIPGETNLENLHEVFGLNSEELENHKARLFPIGNSESERSTVDIFLASLSAVKEYREKLFLSIGINKIKARNVNIHVYTEIEDGNKNNRPDGLIVITSGKITPIIEWTCFVEAKVGDNQLEDEQVERYSDFAREIGINDIITISNYLVTNPFASPIKSKKRNFNFYHWSWEYLRVTASRLIKIDAIEDEDHIYILSELGKYFIDNKNLKNFINMGKDWKVNAAHLQQCSPDQKIKADILDDIVNSLVQEEKDISLQLTDNSKYLVELYVKNNREDEISSMLQSQKVVTSEFILDGNRKSNFFIDIDFIRLEIRCYTNIIIEKGKAQAQTTSLIKMFEPFAGYLEEIYVNPQYPRKRITDDTKIALSDLITEKEQGETFYSCLNKDKGDAVKCFELKTTDTLGRNFLGNKNFIVSLENIAERFLEQVMSNIVR
jgi:hypothetical protein